MRTAIRISKTPHIPQLGLDMMLKADVKRNLKKFPRRLILISTFTSVRALDEHMCCFHSHRSRLDGSCLCLYVRLGAVGPRRLQAVPGIHLALTIRQQPTELDDETRAKMSASLKGARLPLEVIAIGGEPWGAAAEAAAAREGQTARGMLRSRGSCLLSRRLTQL